MIGGKAVCGGGKVCRVRQIGGEQRGHLAGMLLRRFQPVSYAAFARNQRLRIAAQSLGLLKQPKAHTRGPADIGAAVHVVADPAREPPRHRLHALPLTRPVVCGDLEDDPGYRVARLASPLHGRDRLIVLAFERDRIAREIGDAHAFGGVSAARRRSDRVALRGA